MRSLCGWEGYDLWAGAGGVSMWATGARAGGSGVTCGIIGSGHMGTPCGQTDKMKERHD